uniref:Uncharacterized protein n=1 Tax=Molossus molossus TaxID=27622 RepID=A0A7J8C8T2_MOLMO|nr:hypothetical protein HJG59_009914 [Molossus molossus]
MFSLIFLERDRNIDVRKKHPSAQPPLGIKLTTQNIHHIALDTPIGFNIQSSSTSTFSYGIERDRNINKRGHRLATSCMGPTGDQTHNLGMCSDQESNRQLLGALVDAQPLSHTGWAPLYSSEHTLLG